MDKQLAARIAVIILCAGAATAIHIRAVQRAYDTGHAMGVISGMFRARLYAETPGPTGFLRELKLRTDATYGKSPSEAPESLRGGKHA